MLRRLLLLPLLAPLLALLILAALNPRPATSLRLLTWRSPSLPLGLWIALAGAGGAALSAGATGLALRQGLSKPQDRRRTGRGGEASERGNQQRWQQQEPWEQQERWEPESRRQASPRAVDQRAEPGSPPAGWDGAGGSRAPGEPPPTVSVPFRVVRRAAVAEPVADIAGPTARVVARERQPEPVAADDDWNSQASDDW